MCYGSSYALKLCLIIIPILFILTNHIITFCSSPS
nr:MAG TPA: hypothetical protein [Inoviridae sp.]